MHRTKNFQHMLRNVQTHLSAATQIIRSRNFLILALTLFLLILLGAGSVLAWKTTQTQQNELIEQNQLLLTEQENLQSELTRLQNEDQRVRNDLLEDNLALLQTVNEQTTEEYERLLALEEKNYDTTELEVTWAEILAFLADNQYASAAATLESFDTQLTTAEDQLAAEAAVPAPAAAITSNEAPASGYTRQEVQTEIGSYVVSLIAGDLASTRVIVDTASNEDCADNCPVLPLSDYVSRNGAYAGINGTYFCPASYPSCVGKTNSFDLLVMNKNKTYFNSDNNVYSTNPAVIFSNNSVRFVSAASQWGRDTSVDGVLSNFPLLLSGSDIRFAGDGDPKKGSKGNRSFVANKGNTVYIGVVHSATVAEAAWALQSLGMENAINLDNGGSTAFWANGYKVGPGRNIPNALLFVRK